MSLRKLSLFALLGLFTFSAVGAGADAALSDNSDPATIMQAVFKRDLGDRMFAHLRMTITGDGAPRNRTLTLRTLKFDGGIRRLMTFEAPADVLDTGLLMNDYDDSKREDEQWLYLPALHQSTRITIARRSGSFVGSDFSFADLTRPDPKQYKHEFARPPETVEGERAWVIVSTPLASSTEVETGYSKVETWVGQRTLFPLRIKATMTNGRTKYVSAAGVKAVQGIVTPSALTARVVADGKLVTQTVMEQSEVRYGDAAISESDFTKQRLERGH